MSDTNEALQKQQVINLINGCGGGIKSVEASLNKMFVLTELSSSGEDDDEGNKVLTAVDTEVVALVSVVIEYNKEYKICFDCAYTNYTNQGQIMNLNCIKDEVSGASFFFDLEHNLINGGSYIQAFESDDSSFAMAELSGSLDVLNKEYYAFSQHKILGDVLKSSDPYGGLLSTEQSDSLNESIKAQMLAYLNRDFV